MKPYEIPIDKINITTNEEGFSGQFIAKGFDDANRFVHSFAGSSDKPSLRLDFEFIYKDERMISVPFVEIRPDEIPSVQEVLSHHFGCLFADRNLLYPFLDEKERDALVYSCVFEAQSNPKKYVLDTLSEYNAVSYAYECIPDVAIMPKLYNYILYHGEVSDIFDSIEIFAHNTDTHSISEVSLPEFRNLFESHFEQRIPRVYYLTQESDNSWTLADNRDDYFAIVSGFPNRSAAIEFANSVFSLDQEQDYYEARKREAALAKQDIKTKKPNAAEFYQANFSKFYKYIGNMAKTDCFLVSLMMSEFGYNIYDTFDAIQTYSPQAVPCHVEGKIEYTDMIYNRDPKILSEAKKVYKNIYDRNRSL